LSTTFSSQYHPHDVRDALNKMFIENQAKKTEFQAIATEKGIVMPTYLHSLQ